MDKDKCWAELKLTDISRGLSMKNIQNAVFSLFPTPLRFPKESPKKMTLEEFIIEREYRKDER